MADTCAEVLIRPFNRKDSAGVESLYKNVFGESALNEFLRRWEWQFFSNPACESVGSLMWVAEMGGDVVGFLASFPTRFKVFEEEAVIRLPCDLMVSTSARGQGVGEKLIRAYIDSEDLIVNALGYSPASGRMFQRLGYREVDAERLRMRPCDLRPIIRDVLSRRSRWRATKTFAPQIAGVVGGVLNPGLWVVNRVMMPACSTEYDIRECTEADAGFDDLWRRVSPAFPIAAVRDRRWIQWRFLDDPCFEHRLLCAFDKCGGLLGYVDVRVSKMRGLRVGRILDLYCDPSALHLAESLLSAGAGRLEAAGVDMITCLGHLPGLQQVIAKYCYFTPERLQTPALFIWKGENALASAVFDQEKWHLTHADGDDGFSP